MKYFSVTDSMSLAAAHKRYRKLCLTHHPDRGGNKEIFLCIQREYEFIQQSFQQHARPQAQQSRPRTRKTREEIEKELAQKITRLFFQFLKDGL